jgi:membrane protein implicated in regulation of membrane protease activity
MKKEPTTKRNLTDIIILSLSIVALIVGVHQTIYYGFGNAYYLYMISIALLLYQQIRRVKKKQEENQPKLNRRAKRYMDRNG